MPEESENDAAVPLRPATGIERHWGKLVIAISLATAIFSTGFAIWYKYQIGRRIIALWGSQNVELIKKAPVVEALRLETASESAREPADVQVADRAYRIVASENLSRDEGILIAREFLSHDRYYEWQRPRGDCQPRFEYALRFQDGELNTILAFDLECGRVCLAGSDREVSVDPLLEPLKNLFQSPRRRLGSEGGSENGNAKANQTDPP